jgi:pimeloyl-ACP methyl ester carboxylesterase
MRYLICLLLLASLSLSGCQSPAVTTVTATTFPTPKPTATSLTLKPCSINGINAKCGYLHVPEDRKNPNGRILDLKVVVVRAYGPDRQPDPLFYIVGGPGVAVTRDDIVANSHNYIFSKVNAQRDLVFLDQRGTNDRHRLSCESIPFTISDTSQQEVNDWIKQCLAQVDGGPRFYTTAEAMRDLDEARAALGYDKINLYGISYGVEAEQVYMRLFPDHVRAVVMDHGHPLDLPFSQTLPRASQLALDHVLTYCERDAKCHVAYPDIRDDWKTVLDRLTKGPVFTGYTPPGATAPVSVTLDDLAPSVYNSLYAGTYSQIPFVIHELATLEDWTPLINNTSGQSGSSNELEPLMYYIISCFEPASGYQPEEIARLNPNSIFRDWEVKIAQNTEKICAALPKPDPSLIYGPGKPVPLSALMLNSLLDPVFPPSNMDLALKEFTQSRVITEPTEGHEPSGSMCRWDIIAQYIQQGSVDGLDVACMAKQKPSFVTGN